MSYNVKDRYYNIEINNCFQCDHSHFLHFLKFPMGPGSDGPMGGLGGMESHHMNGSLGKDIKFDI